MSTWSRQRQRPGFRRIELAVGLGILLVLGGLTISATIRLREKAALERCRNNLRVIALAAHSYADQNTYLPPGYLGPVREGDAAREYQGVGCLFYLLPYLPSAAGGYPGLKGLDLPEDYLSTTAYYQHWTTYPKLSDYARLRFTEFLCPSDSPERRSEIVYTMYHCSSVKSFEMQALQHRKPLDTAIVAAFEHFLDNEQNHREFPKGEHALYGSYLPAESGAHLGRTSYTGAGGFFGTAKDLRRWAGPYANRALLTVKDWNSADGTAWTFAFGEILGDDDIDGRSSSLSWMVGSCPAAWGTPTGPGSGWWHFSSRHKEVIHFAMGDGSVLRMRKGVIDGFPLQGYYAASGWNDGYPFLSEHPCQ
jgi:hypothetical protein